MSTQNQGRSLVRQFLVITSLLLLNGPQAIAGVIFIVDYWQTRSDAVVSDR